MRTQILLLMVLCGMLASCVDSERLRSDRDGPTIGENGAATRALASP